MTKKLYLQFLLLLIFLLLFKSARANIYTFFGCCKSGDHHVYDCFSSVGVDEPCTQFCGFDSPTSNYITCYDAMCSVPEPPPCCDSLDCSPCCIKGECGAECDSDDDCPSDGWTCNGDIREYRDYYCDIGSCTCAYSVTQSEDCNSYDGWYDTGNTRWVDTGPCTQKEQKEQIWKDYTCSGGACVVGSTGNTRWVDTGNTQNKPDCTNCGYGNWQTDPSNVCKERREEYHCSSGNCVFYQWDYRNKPDGTICDAYSDDITPPGDSHCLDPSASSSQVCDLACSSGSCTAKTNCVCEVGRCGALCDSDDDCSCPSDYCTDADKDGFDDDLVDYPDYGDCTAGCTCDTGTGSGQPCEPSISYNNLLCTSCGNGVIDAGEECEPPLSSDNSNCPNPSSYCENTPGRYCVPPDSFGSCDENCQCVADSFSCSCQLGQCNAECDSDDDCPPQIISDTCYYDRSCNPLTCSCSSGSSEACPDAGTVIGNTCYYDPVAGQRDCKDGTGCNLLSCTLQSGQVCNPFGGCVDSSSVDFNSWIGIPEANLTVGQLFPLHIYVKNTGSVKDNYEVSLSSVPSNLQARVLDERIQGLLPGETGAARIEVTVLEAASSTLKVRVESSTTHQVTELQIQIQSAPANMREFENSSMLWLIFLSFILLLSEKIFIPSSKK